MYLNIFLEVFGGLGLFLYGMTCLSNGMQKIAGDRLKKILAMLTGNRIIGTVMGVFITAVLQSSSVVTVMTVGFVNASLLTLQQALGVILGANIGTTITGWVLVLNIGKYGLPIAGIAAIFYVFVSGEKSKAKSATVMGLGLIFFGLELMSGGLKPLRNMPEFLAVFHSFDVVNVVDGVRSFNYITVIKAAFIGMAMTAIVQSSSATLGITIALTTQGLLNYETAIALVLGENVGTTITAILASLKATANAKRAAYAHTIINVVGVIWVISIFGFYVGFITKIANPDTNVTKTIATAHTIFNISNVLLFIPFVTFLAKFLNYIVKDDKVAEVTRVTHLDSLMAEVPTLVIEQTKNEIVTMGTQIITSFDKLAEIYSDRGKVKENTHQIGLIEDTLDLFEKEITDANFAILQKQLLEDEMAETRENLLVCDEYETISDYLLRIAKTVKKLIDLEIYLDTDRKSTIVKLHTAVEDIFKDINNGYRTGNKDYYMSALKRCDAIKGTYKKARFAHLENIAPNSDAMLSTAYMDMLNHYRRIKDHMYSILETKIKLG